MRTGALRPRLVGGAADAIALAGVGGHPHRVPRVGGEGRQQHLVLVAVHQLVHLAATDRLVSPVQLKHATARVKTTL